MSLEQLKRLQILHLQCVLYPIAQKSLLNAGSFAVLDDIERNQYLDEIEKIVKELQSATEKYNLN